MSTALAPTTDAPIVTADQVALIKQTVASGATDAELKLYLFDCARQGVHPLDRLIHFTKRGGKYTPITSIDFMRTRAADTGEYAGSDDAVFVGTIGSEGFAAHVAVWRLVQGMRCGFSATARWSEYCPAQGQDHMWRKMPHTMLAKCAEALALRKGFPRQLAGLYAKEELDQATENTATYVVEAPAALAPPPAARESSSNPPARSGGDSGHLPDGAVYIERIDMTTTKNPNVKRYVLTLSTGEQVTTIKDRIAAQCEQWAQNRTPVIVDAKASKWGLELVDVHSVAFVQAAAETHAEPVLDSEIPF